MMRKAGRGLSKGMRAMLVQLYMYALDDTCNMSGTLMQDELEFYCQEKLLPVDVLNYDLDGSGRLTLRSGSMAGSATRGPKMNSWQSTSCSR